MNSMEAWKQYHDNGQFDQAEQEISKVIQQNQNIANAYYCRGITYRAQNKYDLALQDFSIAIELNPNNDNTYINRGITYNDLKRYELAFQDYSKAIELNPNYADAYYYRGNTYKAQKNYALAIQDYSKAIELNPNYSHAYNNRGSTYKAQNKYILALQDYSKAVKIIPDLPLLLANLGALLLSQNQYQKAQEYIKKALNILNSSDEQTLKNKFSLSTLDLQFVKIKLELLQIIDEKLQQLSNQLQKLKQLNILTPEQEQSIQETESEVASSILYDSKNNQQDEINNLKNIINLLSEKLENFETNQDIINQDLKQRQENLEKQDHNLIAQKLEEYKQPQNKEKLIYYRSFCPRFLTYIQACMLIQTDLFNVNTDAALETNTEKLVNKINNGAQNASSLLAGIPVVGSVIEISLGIIDYGINCYKEKKFQDKVNNINKVIKSKSGVLSEIEREVQMSSFEIIEKITEQDLVFNNFKFQEIVNKVLWNEESLKIEFVDNPYWKLGVDHSLRALKFIEQDSEAILNEKMEFRDIILKSIKNQDLKSQPQNKVQTIENKCCCCCEIF